MQVEHAFSQYVAGYTSGIIHKNHSIKIKTNKSLIGEIKTDSLLPNINKACDHFELEIYTEIDEAIKRTIEWYSI